MTDIFHLQSTFTKGELDERLFARVDTDIYQKGAKRIRNALVLPQGGVQRRFGLDFIDNISSQNNNDVDPTHYKIIPYEVDDVKWFLIFTEKKIFVYKHEESGASLELVATEAFFPEIDYTFDEIDQLGFTQNERQLIITNSNHLPRIITITNPPSFSFTINDFNFKFFPVYDFNRDYNTINFNVSAKTGENVDCVTDQDFWEARHVDGMVSFRGGVGVIKSLVTPRKVIIDVLHDFSSVSPIIGTRVFVGEKVFSSTRKFPKHVTYFQNRLILANTNSLPSGIWSSVINDLENFNEFGEVELTDSDAVSNYLRGTKSNQVRGILGIRSLIGFTSGGEFSTPLLEDKPLSPGIGFNEQSKYGMKDRTRPIVLDNQIFFIDEGGKIIRNFVYDIQRGAYQSENVSIIAPSLIRSPKDTATFENPDIDDGTFLLLINNDGSMAIYQSVVNQKISAWSLATTNGTDDIDSPGDTGDRFERMASLDNIVYFINKRIINGTPELYLERLNFTKFTDSNIAKTLSSNQDTITGLEHLEGRTVKVIVDGFIQSDKTVSGGAITLDSTATSSFEVGLGFSPVLIPMPINIETQTGNDLYLPKRIKRVYIDFFKSLGIEVNGKLIEELDFEVEFGTPPPVQTGFLSVSIASGFDPREEVVISQSSPLPFLIRGIGYLVDIRGI